MFVIIVCLCFYFYTSFVMSLSIARLEEFHYFAMMACNVFVMYLYKSCMCWYTSKNKQQFIHHYIHLGKLSSGPYSELPQMYRWLVCFLHCLFVLIVYGWFGSSYPLQSITGPQKHSFRYMYVYNYGYSPVIHSAGDIYCIPYH